MTTTSKAVRRASRKRVRMATGACARSGDRQARPAGPDRAGLARGRRARRVPGGRVRGAARGRHRARLGDRHVDRRHQRGADQRQPARGSDGAARTSSGTASNSGGRSTGLFDWMGLGNLLPNFNTVTRGIPAFFTPNHLAIGGSKAEVGVEQASYYSTAPLRDTLSDLVDFEYLCECETRLTVGAVNACSGHMRYFDNRNEHLSVGARDGLGRVAAGVRRHSHRRRAVLGRRHLLQHADRGRARRQAAPRLADLCGQRVAPDSPGADVDLAGDGPAEGHPVRQPRRQPHRAPEADPPTAPCDPRAAQADRRRAATATRRSRSSPPGAAARRCTWRTCWRRASTARTTPRTSTSPAPASRRGAAPGMPTRMRMVERSPWKTTERRPDRRRDRTRVKLSDMRSA